MHTYMHAWLCMHSCMHAYIHRHEYIHAYIHDQDKTKGPQSNRRLSSWWSISLERQNYLNECLQRLRFAPEPTSLQSISLQMFRDLQASDWTVCGVALLRVPGRQLTSRLTLASERLRALHESWNSPVIDSKYKLHIFDVVDFVALEPVQSRRCSRGLW